MDPFTQRMLERARARREKLDTQLSNAGHDVKRRRSPLKDANTILAEAPALTSQLAKSPVKSSMNKTKVSPPSKTTRKSSPSPTTTSDDEEPNKENGRNPISNVRSKLQRMGKLYSEDNWELSSPIHRTEEKFSAEDDDNEVQHRSAKPTARLNRLAALASTINNWEDDLSHPSLVKPGISKAEKIQAKLNEQVKTGPEPQPSTSGYNKMNVGSPTRQMKWDKSVLDNLESQGFTRSKNNSRLVYDYKNGAQESSTPPKELERTTSTAPKIVKAIEKTSSPASSANSTDQTKTPENIRSNPGVSNQTRPQSSRYCYNSSPKSPLIQSPGSVLSKASMFESKNSGVKVKDPTEMTLSERKALFERNKGEAPLIPKAPLTMSVPTKMLQEKDKLMTAESVGVRMKSDTGKSVEAQRNIFEHGTYTQELENNILLNVQQERQRELEMLRSRFKRNKDVAAAAAGACIRTSESSEGKPTSPKNSPICPVKPTPALHDTVPPPPPPLPHTDARKTSSPITVKSSPTKRQVLLSPPKANSLSMMAENKRIKVAPPKSGGLYPDLTGIESSSTETEFTLTETTEAETATCEEQTETETETEQTATEAEYYVQEDVYSSDEEDIYNSSLGRSVLHVVNQHAVLNKQKRSIDPDPDSTTSDISVLDEMDEYLDECLALQDSGLEGPTPPKIKAGKSPSRPSTSFKYSQGASYRSPIKVISPTASPRKEPYIVEGDSCVPLMHSVSFYRKQQSQTPKTPARVISRKPADKVEYPTSPTAQSEEILVQEKVKFLLDEVCKQQTIIGQASQALNLCNATVEFSGSREQVEGERLLLLATHRRQAALNEVQRLKIEQSLRPVVPGASELQESGSLTISAITLPFKKEHLRSLDPDTCLHFVCLVRYLDTVIATPVVQAEPGDSCLRFPSTLKLQDLYSDFKITVEVYSLQTRAEVLPHEIKYHIHGINGGSHIGSKKIAGKTPKKYLKQDSKLIMPSIQSPAGPSAVRSTAFSLAGYVIFSLKEVHRQQFTLNKVSPSSVLEGRLQMHASCELTVSVDHRGFLTMFEDISGFGAWHRRWCLLKGGTLSYWKYPDDERKKTPIGSLDIQAVTTTNVGLVSRDICARPNTFLLETIRPAQHGDEDSLIMQRKGSQTIIRHLLSADTKEDRLEWCSKLNKTLHLIRAWGGASSN